MKDRAIWAGIITIILVGLVVLFTSIVVALGG